MVEKKGKKNRTKSEFELIFVLISNDWWKERKFHFYTQICSLRVVCPLLLCFKHVKKQQQQQKKKKKSNKKKQKKTHEYISDKTLFKLIANNASLVKMNK